MAYQYLLTEIHDHAGLIRFNRPQQLNALNSAVMSEMVAAAEAFDKDDTVGAIVITGGERAFAAGTQRLTHAVGKAIAMEMVLNARFLSADEALRYGLVNRVAPVISFLRYTIARHG